MNFDQVNFCVRCGSALEPQKRAGKMRPVCPECGWIFFPDPKVAVAVLIEKGEQILFVQRAISPRKGYWTLPAGFVDAGEDPREAARREVREETNLQVDIGQLLGILPVQEHKDGANLLIVYRGKVENGKLKAGDDAARAQFFPKNKPPPLAFKSTEKIFSL